MKTSIETKEIYVKVPVNDELGINQAYYQELLAVTLYHKGMLSLKEARELIGKSRREFEEDVLPKYDYTPMDDSPSNAEIEIEASKRL